MTAQRVAAIYDIHGNLPALDAVLADVRRARVDHIVVGGDVVPGPMALEALTRLLELDLPVQFIRGNGDREVLARMRGIETGTVPERFRPVMDWVAAQLRPEHAAMIAGWPEMARMEIAGIGAVHFCHATPRNDTEIFTRTTPDEQLAAVFAGIDTPLVVCGHTHMQFDRMVGATRVVNAGSVGMPFAEPAAYWLQLGPGVELRRTDYDLEAAAERVRATRYPHAEEFAARDVLHPPTEHEMLERFSAVEIR
jgi:putative phosphoesterase